jgi:hypothetical protein
MGCIALWLPSRLSPCADIIPDEGIIACPDGQTCMITWPESLLSVWVLLIVVSLLLALGMNDFMRWLCAIEVLVELAVEVPCVGMGMLSLNL